MSSSDSTTDYQKWHNIKMTDPEDGIVHATIPFDDKLTNPFGVINGSVIATLIDIGSGRALRDTFDEPDKGMLATIDLNVTYLDAATGDLHGDIEVVYAGGSIGVTRADVWCVTEEGQHNSVAVGQTIYRLFRDT